MGVETVKHLPVYDGFRPQSGVEMPELALSRKEPISQMGVYFSIRDKTWKETAKQIALLVLQIVIFPWGIYELARHVVQRLIMYHLYPAQSRIFKFFAPFLNANFLDKSRACQALHLAGQGFIVRHVVLEKNGVRYSGLLMGHQKTLMNGKWVLQATGNAEPYERSASSYAEAYEGIGYNTLMINGPNVGRSEGHATSESMGEVQELGMWFLEHVIEAKTLVTVGRSLGGAAMGQMILRHNFKPDVRYLAVSLVTFDRASNIAAKFIGRRFFPILERGVQKLVQWAGCEMDNVAASRRLQKLSIPEIIVQAGTPQTQTSPNEFTTDRVIPAKACLGGAVVRELGLANKRIIAIPALGHNELNRSLERVTQAILEYFPLPASEAV